MMSFVIFTTFNIWMFAILKTKVLSVNFAKFVSGIINIIWTLVPFILVSFLMLGAFAHIMYFINDRITGVYPDSMTSLRQTYSSLLSFDGLPFYNTVDVSFESTTVVLDEKDSKNRNEMRISIFFGFFIVILLSNVLIAVLGAAWEDISERGRDEFLLFRVRLLFETQEVFQLFDKKDKKEHSIKSRLDSDTSKTGIWSLSLDANYNTMWGESKKFSEVLRRLNLFLRIILNIIYTVLGIFFGLTRPTEVRRALFCIDNSEAIAEKRNRLQTRLRETEEEVKRLAKIDKHITEKPKHLYLRLSECNGIPSRFQLKKEIQVFEKQMKKQKKDVENFTTWEKDLRKDYNKEKKD